MTRGYPTRGNNRTLRRSRLLPTEKPLEATEPQILSTEPLHFLAAALPANLRLHLRHRLLPIPHNSVQIPAVAVHLRLRHGVQDLLQTDDPAAHFPPRLPHRWIDPRHRVQPQKETHHRLVHPHLLQIAASHGVHRLLPLDQNLDLIGFSVDGCDRSEQSADPAGSEGRLDLGGCGGLEMQGIGRGRVVIVGGAAVIGGARNHGRRWRRRRMSKILIFLLIN